MGISHLALQLAQETKSDHIQAIQDSLVNFISVAINQFALPIGSGLIVIAIILAGFRYLQGDAKGGKTALTAAIVGLVIVVLSYFIIYQVVVPAIQGDPTAHQIDTT